MLFPYTYIYLYTYLYAVKTLFITQHSISMTHLSFKDHRLC